MAPSNLTDIMRHEPPDFSLVLGGPLYQLMRQAHLSGDALELLRWRIIGAVLLLVLSLEELLERALKMVF